MKNQSIAGKRRTHVLTLQTVRHFSTLEKAHAHLAHRADWQRQERYAIHQTAAQCWTVSRVIGG